MTRFTLSERAACKLVGLARTTYRYQPKKRDEESLVTRLKDLAMTYPRYGYLLLHGLLKREGRVVNISWMILVVKWWANSFPFLFQAIKSPVIYRN